MRPPASAAAVQTALLGLVLLAAGCADPGATENPLNTPEDGPPVVSVCYPPLVTDQAVIAEIALAACGEAGVADVELDYWTWALIFNECPLFKKMRISFRCVNTAGTGDPDPGAAAPESGAGGAVPTPIPESGTGNP